MGYGLRGADEGAHEFAFDEGGDGVDVEAFGGEEVAGVVDVVDAGGLDVDVGEAGAGEFGGVFGFFESAGDAAGPEFDVAADFGGDLAADDDVGDGEAAAGLEDAEGFGEDAVLVGGEVDDAVGDDDVDGVVGQRDVLRSRL